MAGFFKCFRADESMIIPSLKCNLNKKIIAQVIPIKQESFDIFLNKKLKILILK